MKRLTIDEPGFSEQMLADVAFSPEDLDSAFIEQASLFAYYAEQSRVASKKLDNLKLRIGVIEAQLDKGIRDEAALSGSKLTEKAIEHGITRDDKYLKAVMAYNDAKATAQMLRDILESFKQRKDMLIHIGLTRRDEVKAQNLSVRYQQEDDFQARRDRFAEKMAG
ncbi:MAG: hypothetical protein ACXWT0_03855 [Methylobacter sp.]